jgi:secondary thiamine-phosphate synthase enzyme
MKITNHQLEIPTNGKGFVEVTGDVAHWVRGQEVACGLLNVFIAHTSASLLIQENADSDVLRDMETFFNRLVPEGGRGPGGGKYCHSMEGPDDMPAHIRSALTATSLNIPIVDGGLGLGTWQGIFLYEHRARPHARRLTLTIVGECSSF